MYMVKVKGLMERMQRLFLNVEMFMQGITTINGDGIHTRDFVHVDDVCSAIFLLIEGEWKAEKHHVYNVATQVENFTASIN